MKTFIIVILVVLSFICHSETDANHYLPKKPNSLNILSNESLEYNLIKPNNKNKIANLIGDCPIMFNDIRVPNDIAMLWLNIHNELRNRYGVRPLQWDKNLAIVAQNYADLEAWDLPHNPNRKQQYADLIGCDTSAGWCPSVGENVHYHQSWSFFPFSGCLDGFISEENPNQCNVGGAHYTTMMAAKYDRLGCGGYIDDATRFHLVCNYAESTPYTGVNPFPPENCSITPEEFQPITTDCYEIIFKNGFGASMN